MTTSTALRSEFSTSLAEHLAEANDADGMTRGELARRLAAIGAPVTEQAVGCWLRGETTPSLPHQAAIARVLNVPVHRLFPVRWVAS